MSPAPIVPSSASVSAWRPTSASEWPSRRSGLGDAHAEQDEAVAGREAWTSKPRPVPATRPAPSSRSARARSVRLGDLEVALVAGHQRDRRARPRRRARRRRSARRRQAPVRREDPVDTRSPAASAPGTGPRARPCRRPRRPRPASACRSPAAPAARRRACARPSSTRSITAARAAAGRRRGSAPAPAGRRPGSPGRAAPSPAASRRPTPASSRSSPAAASVIERRVVGVDHRAHRVDAADAGRTLEAWRSSGLPASGRYCLGSAPPKRSPRPDGDDQCDACRQAAPSTAHSRPQAASLGTRDRVCQAAEAACRSPVHAT